MRHRITTSFQTKRRIGTRRLPWAWQRCQLTMHSAGFIYNWAQTYFVSVFLYSFSFGCCFVLDKCWIRLKCLMAIIISKTMENSLFSVSFMHVCTCFHQSTNFSNFVGLNRNENPLSTKHEHTKFIHFSHIYQGKFFLLHMFKFNSMIFGKWFWKIQRGLPKVLNDLSPLNEIHWILFSFLLLF